MAQRRVRLTVAEAAALAGVSPITVRSWIVRGHLRRDPAGYLDGAALLAYLDGRSHQGRRTAPRRDRPS